MRVTLTNIRVAKSAARTTTTHCYSATLEINGVPAARVGNTAGHGPDYFKLHPDVAEEDWQHIMDAIARFRDQLPVIGAEGKERRQSLSEWAREQVDHHVWQLAARAELNAAIHIIDASGTVHRLDHPPTRDNMDALARAGNKVLNRMPLEVAAAILISPPPRASDPLYAIH